MTIQSLQKRGHALADPAAQREFLAQDEPAFETELGRAGLLPFTSVAIDMLQVNAGRVCNQACGHCHVDAAPDRKETASREVLEAVLEAAGRYNIRTVDITGGAPEMNPHFRWFVETLSQRGHHVIVRCNLTILTAASKFEDLPEFYAAHGVEIVSSLPHYSAARTDAQRGQGVFSASIEGLRRLNKAGYGTSPGLLLHLVYNPSGAFLAPDQAALEAQYRRELKERFHLDFNRLYCITNMPVSRFLEFLVRSGNYTEYMDRLTQAFNPAAAASAMCRSLISVGYDGRLFDCDFNQMLDLPVKSGASITELSPALFEREIVTGRHCFGCAAGAGSSCGGATAEK